MRQDPSVNGRRGFVRYLRYRSTVIRLSRHHGCCSAIVRQYSDLPNFAKEFGAAPTFSACVTMNRSSKGSRFAKSMTCEISLSEGSIDAIVDVSKYLSRSSLTAHRWERAVDGDRARVRAMQNK